MRVLYDPQSSKHTLTVQRETSDKPYGWGPTAAESNLMYTLKQVLSKAGFDVIKKLVHKDGHLFGHDQLTYVRSNPKHRLLERDLSFYVYDGQYAIRLSSDDWNQKGTVDFHIDFAVVLNGQPNFAGAEVTRQAGLFGKKLADYNASLPPAVLWEPK